MIPDSVQLQSTKRSEMAEETTNETALATAQQPADGEERDDWQSSSSKLVRFYSHPWTQILLISLICFCLPGVRLPSSMFLASI